MGAWAADPTSHEGWNQDLVMVGFSDDGPASSIVDQIDAAVRSRGWRRSDTV